MKLKVPEVRPKTARSSNEKMTPRMIWARTQYQYSERRARPENPTYWVRTLRMASVNDMVPPWMRCADAQADATDGREPDSRRRAAMLPFCNVPPRRIAEIPPVS